MLDPKKKVRILGAATDMFARYGFKKSSIDEIATTAGVGKGTVYLAFDSKEDLFYQVVHREIRVCAAQVSERIDPRKPADELLVSCSLDTLERIEAQPLLRDLVLGRLDRVVPMWRKELEDLRAIGRLPTVEVLELGVRQGAFRSDLEVEQVARIVQDMQIAGLLLQPRFVRSEDDQRRLGLIWLDLVLNGLMTRD
ncbi:MAG: TetR/AcrR family transcriptional regulator [Deltaproteobacteria bacterium]|nr:TetR/AcrR family transcriptional regulator [Deltaproteobacteria bacterium]